MTPSRYPRNTSRLSVYISTPKAYRDTYHSENILRYTGNTATQATIHVIMATTNSDTTTTCSVNTQYYEDTAMSTLIMTIMLRTVWHCDTVSGDSGHVDSPLWPHPCCVSHCHWSDSLAAAPDHVNSHRPAANVSTHHYVQPPTGYACCALYKYIRYITTKSLAS